MAGQAQLVVSITTVSHHLPGWAISGETLYVAARGLLRAQWPCKGFQDLTTEVPECPLCCTFCQLSLNEKGRCSLPLQGKCRGLFIHLYASLRHWMDIWAECMLEVKEALSQELWHDLVICPRRGQAGWQPSCRHCQRSQGDLRKQHHRLRLTHCFFPSPPLNPKALWKMSRSWRGTGWRTEHSPS